MKRFFALPLILLLACCTTAQTNLNIVKTDAGDISGAVNQDGSVHIFKGIPFAAPPVGDLRWKEPQPVKSWSGVKACTAYGPSPMQAEPNPFGVYTKEFLIAKQPISEDCLYLNVWTGAQLSGEKRPVLVYIYGGGFVSGGTNVPIYDGEAMAKKGIIFVTINYRVGIFGFFAHPELTKESPHSQSGNYGIMDQLAALQWVQKNIAAFGGDPEKVTIAGQSAGSMSVNYLVTSPLGKGLFNGAIAESGAYMLPDPSGGTSLAQGEQSGVEAAKALNANSLAELRKLPAQELLKQNNFRPIIDGYVMPKTPPAIYAENQENKVALLTGWNEDDAFFGELKDAADYKAQMQHRFGDKAAEALKLYPGGNDSVAKVSQIRLSRDGLFGIQNYSWVNAQSAKNGAPVYLYRFTRRMPATPEFEKYGAFHTGEVAYAYDNLKFVNRPFQPVDQQLANTMSAYWVNFTKNGNPNGKGLPEWPAYNTQTNMTMILGKETKAEPLPDKAALDFTIKQLTQH
ncbi:carboxylesterase/lipase family protein [Mucilaginibacter segetis]|uniref:Carboxylic ester hydrolase n=1 Tax=Mucilaginibacter segetis TaxID=2793071 RepID=A0A934PUT2_9SPHI|nr:carboxylesterase family protein [Mucilaginibacter segetis]MBK0379785.1 carboxylesterase family protein [Mucilaginibacter segetis]